MLSRQSYVTNEAGDDFLCREATQSLFGQPDVTAAHEYLHVYRSNTAHTPEKKLIAAVLQDAIDCYIKHSSAKTRRGRRIFTEAAQWIFSQEDDWLFSYESICEMLNVDPDYIRRVLMDKGEQQLNLLKHSECRQIQEPPLRLAS